MSNDQRLTGPAFAEAVGISYRTLRRYIKRRQVVPRKHPSGRVFFTGEDVARYKSGLPVNHSCKDAA